jgi:hypothetical protein
MLVRIQIEGETPRTREFEFADNLTEEDLITNALLALAPEEYSSWSAMYLVPAGSTEPRVILNKKALNKKAQDCGSSSEALDAEDMELGDQGQSGG